MQADFVAAVSHEFRTPITALTHLTELLESGDAPPDRLPLYYKALAKETRRLRDMVENLLDFGRIEAGRYKYRPEPTDAAAFLAEILDDFRQQPVAAGRDLSCQTAPASLPLDREAMRRAVWNLLDNAAKYSPPSTPIAASLQTRPGWTAISVADHGPGIPPEDHARIFQKFVRGRHESGKGTGIGLAMADAIVRAHGGRIELVSTPGQGSTFTILLPNGPQ
jgi:signal transduction histidine kinase